MLTITNNQERGAFVLFLVVFLFSSCVSTKHSKESKIFEFYTGFASTKHSLLLDKLDSTFTYSNDAYAMIGSYSKMKNDTLFLCVKQITFSSDETITHNTNCIRTFVFRKKSNYMENITIEYYNLKQEDIDIILKLTPQKIYKVKIPILSWERFYLKNCPWIIR